MSESILEQGQAIESLSLPGSSLDQSTIELDGGRPVAVVLSQERPVLQQSRLIDDLGGNSIAGGPERIEIAEITENAQVVGPAACVTRALVQTGFQERLALVRLVQGDLDLGECPARLPILGVGGDVLG